jgi:hypothetical protein
MKEKQLDIVLRKELEETTIRLSVDCCSIEKNKEVISKINEYMKELIKIISS